MLDHSDLFFHLLYAASAFFETPLEVLLNKLAITRLLPFLYRQLTAFAAVTYSGTSAFSRNSSLVSVVGRHVVSYSEPYFRYAKWFRELKLCLLVDPDPAVFVSTAIDAFGCRKWLDSEGADFPTNLEPWLPACLICRFFIQLMSDTGRVDSWDRKDVLRRSIANLLKVGPLSTQGLTIDPAFGTDSPIFLDILREIGDAVMINGERKYRLKAEFENQVSPFSLLFAVPLFLEQLGHSMGRQGNDLIAIPPVDEANGPRMNQFILTDAFSDFISGAAKAAARSEDSPLRYSLIALVHMTAEAARSLQTAVPVDKLLSRGVFGTLSMIDSLKQPLIRLMELIKCGFPSAAETLETHITSLRSSDTPRPRAGRDRSQVLNAFAEQRAAFQVAAQADLEAIDGDDPAYVCAACHAAIKTDSEIWGRVWTGRSIHLCPHVLHLECHRRDGCPICKSLAPLFTPILLSGYTPVQKEAVRPTIQFLISGDFAATVERMAQLLDFDETTELPATFVDLMQTISIAAADFEPEELAGQPLLLFLSLLTLARDRSDFDWLTRAMWQSLPCPMKSAAILWNCVATDLPTIDLASLRAPPPDLYLRSVPERFIDLFLPEFGGDEILKHDCPVCRCLKCGACVVIADPGRTSPDLIIAHARMCNLGLFLGLTGELATNVFRICRSSHTAGRAIRALYVTSDGDEDIGLRIGMPVVLSHERHRELIRDVLSGLYITDA
jgi:hypothetical protein